MDDAYLTEKYQSINYPILEHTTLKVPIWASNYWEALEEICKKKALWLAAEKKLKKEEAHKVLDLLSTVPWNYSLPQSLGYHIVELAQFYMDGWLGENQMDQMSLVINHQLQLTDQSILS